MAGALPAVPRPTGSTAPELVLLLSLPMLRHADVLRCGAAGRFWSAVSLGPAVWGALCDREWKGKVYIPAAIRRARELEPRRAFREALLDARRTWIRAEELVELQWWHRMKASAGEHFTQSDPWWRGAAAGPLSFRCREDHTTCWIDPDSQRPFGDGTWRFVPR
ncbi:unnamed protein product [Prorocentrum cordatum]|uniref:Uncharacterized protein n=1 Tax=Prorocentrum cordatum TaxID=2364126 RepID=A0ABN9R4G4_9DINO|nr:unnamed protein product [Polarella glacialis]